MSSHHFVKEKQEPALIIANGESCSNELLNQLLEWSPYILVLDGALDRVLARGIKVDAVLGDFDSITTRELNVQDEQDIRWVHAEDQTKTDLEKGLEFLIQEGHEAVNIVWATGRRLDHAHNNLITMAKFRNELTICMLDDHSRAFCLKPAPSEFIKRYPTHSILSLIPLTDVQGVSTKGLLYNLNDEDLEIPQRTGSSNEVVTPENISITFKSGILILMECFD